MHLAETGMKPDLEREDCCDASWLGHQLGPADAVLPTLPYRVAPSSASSVSQGKRHLARSLTPWKVPWIYLTSALKSTRSGECRPPAKSHLVFRGCFNGTDRVGHRELERRERANNLVSASDILSFAFLSCV